MKLNFNIAILPLLALMAATRIHHFGSASLLPLAYHNVSVSHKYQSDSYAQDDFDNSLGRQQAYNASNFNYQLSDHKHWTVDFSVLNLFDVQNGQFVDFGMGEPVVYPTNYQRTFQGSVSYRF